MDAPGNGRTFRAAKLDVAAMARHADEAGDLLKAMASPPRLMVLCNLARAELSVGELLERIPLSASALSQHLAVLRGQGLVTTRREAQSIYYMLNSGPAQDIIGILYASFCSQPAGRGRRTRRSASRSRRK